MAEVKSRTQGSRPRSKSQKNPRPRTHPPTTDPIEVKDRIARGQGHSAEVFSQKKVNAQNVRKFSANFRQSQKKQKKGLRPQIRIFSTKFLRKKFLFASSLACSKTKQHCSWHWYIFNRSKNSAVLEPKTCRVRGQSQGLHLRGLGQGLQIVSSRPRTFSRTPPLHFST